MRNQADIWREKPRNRRKRIGKEVEKGDLEIARAARVFSCRQELSVLRSCFSLPSTHTQKVYRSGIIFLAIAALTKKTSKIIPADMSCIMVVGPYLGV